MGNKILLVEDEIIIAMSEKEELEKYGYSVTDVVNGEQAIKLVLTEESNFDLILMDIDLGKGIDGTEVAQKILEKRDIPILFLSSHSEPSIVEKTEKITSYGYVLKSSSIVVLDTSIKMALKLFKEKMRRREVEEKLKATMQSIGDAVITCNIDGTVNSLNPVGEKLTGWSNIEAYGKPIGDVFNIVNAKTFEKAEDPVPRALKEGVIVGLANHTLLISKNGNRYHIADSCAPISTKDGKVLGAVLVFRDMTEEYKQREKLKEKLLRQEKEAEVVAKISISNNLIKGNIKELAIELTELASQALAVERAGVWLFNDEEDRLVNIDQFILSEGKHFSGEVLFESQFKNEFEYLKTSKYIDANDPLTDPRTAGYVEGYLKPNHISSMLDAVIRSGGNNLGTLCFEHVDKEYHWEDDEISFACQLADQFSLAIANRAKNIVQEALKESEMYYKSIFEFSGSPMLIVEEDGTIIKANQECKDATGYTPEELIGTKWLKYVSSESLEIMLKYHNLRRIDPDNAPNKYEVKLINKNGEIRDVMLSVGMIRDKKQSAVSMLDITERKYAEKELKESKEYLQAVFDSINDGLFVDDADTGQIIDVNKRCCDMYGYTYDEMIQTPIGNLSLGEPPYSQKEALEWLRKTRVEGSQVFPWLAKKKDGTLFWVEVNTHFVVIGGKNRFVVSVRDITKRKKIEDKLKESENNFQTLFNSIQDMIIVSSLDGRVLYVNEAFKMKLGYTLKDLETIGVYTLYSEDNRVQAEKIFTALLNGDYNIYSLPVKSKNGVLIPVEIKVSSGKWNDLNCMFCILKDLTSEQESLQRFEHIFRNNPAPMAISDMPPNDKFRDVNNAFLNILGYSKDDLIGKTSREVGIFLDQNKLKPLVEQVVKNGHISNIELSLRAKDGSIHTGLFSGELISIQRKEYFLSVMIDITDRKRIEEELKLSEEEIKKQLEEKEILLREVHHRVKNNIANIESLLLLQSNSITNKEAKVLLQESIGRVKSIRILYDKLLLTKDYHEISIRAYIENLIDSIASVFNVEKWITINKEITDFLIDSKRAISIGIIINELLTNVFKYAFAGRDNGNVLILMEKEKNRVTLIIEDNGIGIDKESSLIKSTGLGLTLVKMLIEQLQGTYSVENKNGTKSIINFEI